MALWGFRWFRLFLNPYSENDFEHRTESDRRIYILGRLEGAKWREWSWVLVVAGVGFFTDAYSIFAINMVVPILGIIYYGGNNSMPHSLETALSVVTLGGSIIGQIAFGLGADLWGRRKMYGLELIITIGATLGVVMSSKGIDGSMSIIVWLLVWRFVLGIGIGADYPLSAVICSEFAPTRLRGKMLTLVFMCQPLGQLAATLVALIAAVRQRKSLPPECTVNNSTVECLKTMDSIWRWIIGVGVIPAVIALWFRLTIIESPRYTADVGRDSRKAVVELDRYLPSEEGSPAGSSTALNVILERQPLVQRTSAFGISEDETTLQYPPGENSHAPQHFSEHTPVFVGGERVQDSERREAGTAPHNLSGEISHSYTPTSIAQQNPTFERDENGGMGRMSSHIPSEDPSRRLQTLNQYPPVFVGEENGTTLHNLSGENSQQPHPSGDQADPEIPNTEEELKPPPEPSWADFKDYFWKKGNLRTLMATSFCWFCVDLPFYGLGVNSPRIISFIWDGYSPAPAAVYSLLVHNVWQSLVIVSIGAILGSIITLITIDTLGRRKIQIIGFFWLFILFVVIGGSFNYLYQVGKEAAIIVLYILCQIFFNFGPNTITYILPAELFPTRYRGLCHGISAAFGKLGSVIAQLFLAYINYGQGINYSKIQKWLPFSLLIGSFFMLCGLAVTIWWIPGDEYNSDGKVKTLEQWEVGRPPNTFSETWLARIFAAVYRWLAAVLDAIYLWMDKVSGGDEAENRVRLAEEEREEERLRQEESQRHAEERQRLEEAHREEEGHMEEVWHGRAVSGENGYTQDGIRMEEGNWSSHHQN